MNALIAWIRLIALLITTVVFIMIIILFYYITPRKIWIYVIRFWGDCVIYCVGAKLEIIGDVGDFQQTNSVVIANHVSWIDIPVLCKLYVIKFISRAEVKKWFLLNLLVNAGGTIFIDRDRKKDLLRVTHLLRQQLTAGDTIGFFPEAKTTDGSILLPFKSSLFESAIVAKSQIIPIAIVYCNKNNERTDSVTYADEITLWQTIYNTLLLNNIRVKVIILPKVNAADFANRKQLAAYLFEQIQGVYQDYITKYCNHKSS
jgi:1-acyl-sn-glycerol-3-phosphate acyltransferase